MVSKLMLIPPSDFFFNFIYVLFSSRVSTSFFFNFQFSAGKYHCSLIINIFFVKHLNTSVTATLKSSFTKSNISII